MQKRTILIGNDGFDVFNESSVEKQAFESPESLQKLPILKDEVLKRLKELDEIDEKLDAKVEDRIHRIQS